MAKANWNWVSEEDVYYKNMDPEWEAAAKRYIKRMALKLFQSEYDLKKHQIIPVAAVLSRLESILMDYHIGLNDIQG